MKKFVLFFLLSVGYQGLTYAQADTYLMKPTFSFQGASVIDTIYFSGFNYVTANCTLDSIYLRHSDSIIFGQYVPPYVSLDSMGLAFTIPPWADTGKWDLIFVYGLCGHYVVTYPGRFAVLPASASVSPASNSNLMLSAVSNPAGRNIAAMVNAPFSASATLELYDALGHVVAALPPPRLQIGDNEFTFDCSALPSGNYYLRLSTNGTVKTVNLTLEH
jgi:hypothetical protein